MIEVLKTNVRSKVSAGKLISILSQNYPNALINFDLQDCDRILRIEGENFLSEAIIRILEENGFLCKILTD